MTSTNAPPHAGHSVATDRTPEDEARGRRRMALRSLNALEPSLAEASSDEYRVAETLRFARGFAGCTYEVARELAELLEPDVDKAVAHGLRAWVDGHARARQRQPTVRRPSCGSLKLRPGRRKAHRAQAARSNTATIRVSRRSACRARGAGRPAARSQSGGANRGGDSGDSSGPGDEGPGALARRGLTSRRAVVA